MKTPRFTPAEAAALEAGLSDPLAIFDACDAHTRFEMVQTLTGHQAAEYLYNQAFNPAQARDARSAAYKLGVKNMLLHKLCKAALVNEFKPGTAESDAWYAGHEEARGLLRSLLVNGGGVA